MPVLPEVKHTDSAAFHLLQGFPLCQAVAPVLWMLAHTPLYDRDMKPNETVCSGGVGLRTVGTQLLKLSHKNLKFTQNF